MEHTYDTTAENSVSERRFRLLVVPSCRKGRIQPDIADLFHNDTNSANTTSTKFFYIVGKFYGNDSLIYMAVNENNWDPILTSQMNDTGFAKVIDGFAKAFYSSILLDLGSPSPLTDEKAITYLLSERNDDVYGVNATEAVETFRDSMSPLKERPAQLSLQYVCSVPKQKDITTTIVSIIIADIVLLSSFWSVLNWAATRWLSVHNENWNQCIACSRQAVEPRMESKMDGGSTHDESTHLVANDHD